MKEFTWQLFGSDDLARLFQAIGQKNWKEAMKYLLVYQCVNLNGTTYVGNDIVDSDSLPIPQTIDELRALERELAPTYLHGIKIVNIVKLGES